MRTSEPGKQWGLVAFAAFVLLAHGNGRTQSLPPAPADIGLPLPPLPVSRRDDAGRSAVSPASVPITGRTVSNFSTPCGSFRLIQTVPSAGGVGGYGLIKTGYNGPGHLFFIRRIATKERDGSAELDLRAVAFGGLSGVIAQGSVRVIRFDAAMCPPQPERLKAAVALRLMPAYRRERAWVPIPQQNAWTRTGGSLAGYDPNSLEGSSSSNYVGITSGQGGESAASRGFVHDLDAMVVDRVLHGEPIGPVYPALVRVTLESLAQPQGAVWSFANSITVDPQFPLSPDRPYETWVPVSPNPAVESMLTVRGWGRDVAHLENTGFTHWLLSGDPLAGLLIQRQAAFALASFYENYRGGFGGVAAITTYHANHLQERSVFNLLSALWKSRTVAAQSSGGMFWSRKLADRQASEIIADLDKVAAEAPDYARTSGLLFGAAGREAYEMADGQSQTFNQASAFMAVQYGKEPLWLWAKSGNRIVLRWFRSYASNLAARMTVIGGTAGVDGLHGVRGSGIALGPVTGPLPYRDIDGWARWARALPLREPASRTNFDGAAVHTAVQVEGMLLYAKDLDLPVQAALTRMAALRTATTALKYPGLMMMKHLGSPQ